jgi:DNA primase
VPAELGKKLGLGHAPEAWDALSRAIGPAFPEGVLLEAGLAQPRTEGRGSYDRFRNRLLFVLRDERGRPVGFGGRALSSDTEPKYLNSPETPIYSKSRTLYGLNLTKADIRKLGFAVLVEGYFDFAQMFQSQAAPVVASCGTALTPHQAQLLRRFTTKVVLSYDPDAAGEGAAARSSDLLVAEGFDVNVVVLDRGEDPDTFIRNQGPDRYRERLRQSRPYLEYLLDQAASGLDFGRDDSRRAFLGRMLTVAARIPDAAARDQFADRIAHKARITEDVVRAEIRKAAAGRRTQVTALELPSFGQMKNAEKGLIWSLVHNTREAFEALDELEGDDLEGLAGRDIFELARSLHGGPLDLLPSTLLQRLSTVNAQLVTSIAATTSPPAPPVECARALKRLRWERERAAIQREIDRLQDMGATRHGQEIDALWQKKKDLLHRIEDLT